MYKLYQTVSKNVTSLNIKKLKKATEYKFMVVAYKNIDGQKITIASSVPIYTVTIGGKFSVAKSVKINKIGSKKNATKITLKKGKTAKIKASEVSEYKNKSIKHQRKLAFETSNKNVATISKSGKIKAVGKGKCNIFVYAQNSVYKIITITVK